MKLRRLIIDSRDIGAAFGESDAEEQAELINASGSAIFVDCGSQYRFEMQLSYLADELDENGERFILELAEMIKLRGADSE